MAGVGLSLLLAMLFLGSGCGARSGIRSADSSSRDAGRADARPDAPPEDGNVEDVGSAPDRDCPRVARPEAPCEVEKERICFYPADDGLIGCRCDAGRWVCEPAVCSGWGPECRGSIREDSCVESLGCGACCSLAGRDALSTWCDCDESGERPYCTVDGVCSGP